MKFKPTFWGACLIFSLFLLQLANYSTTNYGLSDLLGPLKILGISWADIVTIALCGMDFAGIARIFTVEQGKNEPAGVVYLTAAWLIVVFANSGITWWAVTVAIQNNPNWQSELIQAQWLYGTPILIAILLMTLRMLVIGTFNVFGERVLLSSR